MLSNGVNRRQFLKKSTLSALVGASALLPFPLTPLSAAVRKFNFVPHAGQAGAFWAMVENGKFV